MAGSGGRTRACLPACPVRRLVCRRPEWSSPRTPRRRPGQAPGPRHCAQSPSRAWRPRPRRRVQAPPGPLGTLSESHTPPVIHASALPDLSSLPSGTAIPRPTPSCDAAPCHGLFGKLHLLKCPRAPAPLQPMLRMRLAPADQDVGRVLLVLVTSSVSAPWECPSSRQSVRFVLFLPTPRKVPPCPPARPSPLKSRRCCPFGFVSVLNCSDAKTETGARRTSPKRRRLFSSRLCLLILINSVWCDMSAGSLSESSYSKLNREHNEEFKIGPNKNILTLFLSARGKTRERAVVQRGTWPAASPSRGLLRDPAPPPPPSRPHLVPAPSPASSLPRPHAVCLGSL